jgi:hypothetical protein
MTYLIFHLYVDGKVVALSANTIAFYSKREIKTRYRYGYSTFVKADEDRKELSRI